MKDEITFFIGSLEEGGAERVVANLANRLVLEKNISIVLYYDREIFYDIDNRVDLHVIEKEIHSKSILKSMIWMRRYFKKNSAVVISFLTIFNILAILSLLFIKVPLIISERSDPYYAPNNKLIRLARDLLYNMADSIIVQTKHSKGYFSKTIQKKCSIIKNPINVGEYIGAGLNTKKKNTIVSVGRLFEVKNQKMLIEAFSLIANEFPDYVVEIYGDGPLESELKNYIESRHLEQRVVLKGSTKDVYRIVSESRIFVLTSNYEGMPNALIEAMCIGTPVISTKDSGVCELIDDGFNGVLVDINDYVQLADAISMMINNPFFAHQCAENALIVNQSLSMDVVIDKWKHIIMALNAIID